MGLEHEHAGQAAHPVDVGQAAFRLGGLRHHPLFRVVILTPWGAISFALVGAGLAPPGVNRITSTHRPRHYYGPYCNRNLHPSRSCDAKMYHMKKASIRDLRYRFSKVEDLLREGEEIHITKRKRVIARLLPPEPVTPKAFPDFLGRAKKIFGKKPLKVSGAELIRRERDERY